MPRLVVPHGGDGSRDTVVHCRPGTLLALVDIDSGGAPVEFTIDDGGHPVTVLDERCGDVLRGQVAPRAGVTTVLVTHDVRGLASLVDTVVVVYASHAVEVGPAAVLQHNPRHPLSRRLQHGGRPPKPVTGPHDGCPYVAECPLGDALCRTHTPGLRHVADRQVACHYAELGSSRPLSPAMA